MARQHRKVLSGGVIVLCVVLLLAPATHSQSVKARRKTFVLSGSVGLPDVTMQGLPGAPQTDGNGVYTAEVEYGWKGTVTPVKLGYTFSPPQRVYQKVVSNQPDENYEANLLTFTISGSAGQPGVTMAGLPGDPVTDSAGRYTATVEYGWSGTVMPEKMGYRFDPSSRVHAQVTQNQTNQNYTAHELTFTLSGSVGADGVSMKGLPGNVITGGGGMYRIELPYGWTGTVTPTKEGHEFSPASRDYPAIMSAQTNQDYTARVFTYQISGTTNQAGVILKGLPDDPISDNNGYYMAIVPHGWSGKVTPDKPGYTFSPPSKSYQKVISDHDSQDYSPTVIQLTISGNTGTAGVTLDGLPGNVVSDATGFYTAKVEYGWSGTVTPMKDGWMMDPSSQVYSAVTSDRVNQNFRGQRITFDIGGNAGLAGVLMEGLPGRPISGPDGSYTAKVGYKWSGTVTPKKQGYTFEPPSTQYSELLMPQPSQDYVARVLQYTISGRIVTEEGPAANVFMLADNDGGSATTDANGEYQLTVDYGWQGKVTPQQDGYTFTPTSKLVQRVLQNISNVGFVGKIKMVSITNAIDADGEPIQGVAVTAKPGDYRAVSDAKGKYTVRVPYGWSGGLSFEKEGWEFDAIDQEFTNVTEDIDRSAPPAPPVPDRAVIPPVTPPVTSPAEDTLPVTPPVTPPVTTPDPGVGTERDALVERMRQIQEELDRMRRGEVVTPGQVPPITPPQPPRGRQYGLITVLKQLSADMNVQIGVDATVKPIPISLDFDPTTVPVPTALQRILEPIAHMYKEVDGKYLVYKPINNTFQGDDLRQALQDIAADAGVTIVPDPNVVGEVWAELVDVPLETALQTVLAGSPFIVHVTPDYYLVADRGVESDAFMDINVTRNVYLNYTSPQKALQLLSSAYAPYVRADTDPNSHLVSITADPDLVDKIARVVKELDTRPQHVLLDARVVTMERGDLLDVGLEWTFPTISAGAFGTDEVSSWPWGVQIGYTPDRTFTDQLLIALNLLEQNGQAEIMSNTQLLAQDGKLSDFGVIKEEYYMLVPPIGANAGLLFSQTEMVTIESGTKLTITPRIGDNNDITLYMATEVSNSIPAADVTQLPEVTRRTARNVVTVQNGGTAALAGLTENRAKKIDKKVPGLGDLPLIGGLFKNTEDQKGTREIAVFVTANLVDDTGRSAAQPAAQQGFPVPPQPAPQNFMAPPPQPAPQGYVAQPQPVPQGYAVQPQPQPTGPSIRDGIAEAIARQPR